MVEATIAFPLVVLTVLFLFEVFRYWQLSAAVTEGVSEGLSAVAVDPGMKKLGVDQNAFLAAKEKIEQDIEKKIQTLTGGTGALRTLKASIVTPPTVDDFATKPVQVTVTAEYDPLFLPNAVDVRKELYTYIEPLRVYTEPVPTDCHGTPLDATNPSGNPLYPDYYNIYCPCKNSGELDQNSFQNWNGQCLCSGTWEPGGLTIQTDGKCGCGANEVPISMEDYSDWVAAGWLTPGEAQGYENMSKICCPTGSSSACPTGMAHYDYNSWSYSCSCQCGWGAVSGAEGCTCSNPNYVYKTDEWGSYCDCPANLQCDPGSYFDWNTCSCKCYSTATATSSDPQNLACQCPTNYQWDAYHYSCKCASSGTCPSPKVFSNTSGNCGCVCPSGMVNDGNGGCACPSGKVLNESGNGCVCDSSIVCSGGAQLNTSTCACTCPSGTTWNGSACVCSDAKKTITNGQCACDMTIAPSCQSPSAFNAGTCQCACPDSSMQLVDLGNNSYSCACPSGKILQNNSCVCDPNSSPQCHSPATLNSQTCSCSCPSIAGVALVSDGANSYTCACSDSKKTLSNGQCECTSDNRPSCGTGAQLSADKCSCVCKASGMTLQNDNSCICTDSSKVYNSSSNSCGCPAGLCSNGFTPNAGKNCACECTGSNVSVIQVDGKSYCSPLTCSPNCEFQDNGSCTCPFG